MNFFRSYPPAVVTLLLIVFLRVGLSIPALTRSFWTDEAWVANAISDSSLYKMFFPDTWLQTSPPLFLLFSRLFSSIFGPGEASLRSFTFFLSLPGLFSFLLVARYLFLRPLILIAAALILLKPESLRYSIMLKQYGVELAFCCILLLAILRYLLTPSTANYVILLTVSLIAVTSGYGLALMLPAVALSIAAPHFATSGHSIPITTAIRRTLGFIAMSSVTLAVVYFFIVKPNSSSDLHQYWREMSASNSWHKILVLTPYGYFRRALPLLPYDLKLSDPLHLLILWSVLILILAAMNYILQNRRHWAHPSVFLPIFAIICILSAEAADILHLYPNGERTGLFTLPLAILLLVRGAQSSFLFVARSLHFTRLRLFPALLAFALLAFVSFLVLKRMGAKDGFLIEDFKTSISFLKSSAAPLDTIWIQGSTAEAYRYYSNLLEWAPQHALVANLGWGCCPRNRPTSPSTTLPADIEAELESRLPAPHPGRIWLLYTDRPTHYQFLGFDERLLFRGFFAKRRCRLSVEQNFTAVSVIAFDCP